MRLFTRFAGVHDPRRDLVLLALASLTAVAVLTGAVVARDPATSGAFDWKQLGLALLVLAASGSIALLLWRSSQNTQQVIRTITAENADLRRRLATLEVIIRAEPQVIVYWDRGDAPRVVTNSLAGVPGLPAEPAGLMSYGSWLDAASAETFKAAAETLLARGTAFNLIVRTVAGAHLEADGRAAGGRAVLRLRDVAGYRRDLGRVNDLQQLLSREIRTSRALINALPLPVWLNDEAGRIVWANAAYVGAVEASGLAEVTDKQMELLDSRQRHAVGEVVQAGGVYRSCLPLIIGQEQRAHDVISVAVAGMRAGAAIDVAEIEAARRELHQQSAAYDRTLDRVGTAVAIFDRAQRLSFCNQAYVNLWQVDPQWLETAPSDGAILDRLRDLGRLPDVVNYRDWKARVLSSYVDGGEQDDQWHLPDGRTIRFMAGARPDGGVTYLFSDETERVALASSYNALIRVQRETLDSLKEGVAVFASDGRIKLFNTAFAAIWKLSPDALAQRPHIEDFIALARVLYDDARTWTRLSRAVTAFSRQREALEGQMVRPDSSVIDFATVPLPDGGTLITFADVTKVKRYERALVERNEALEAADRLKNHFISHVSYELRTPLTNIIGFSELLSSPHFGSLNAKQHEYLGDITASSRTLLAIIDDILDLASIDAGALELKLVPVKVRAVVDAAIAGIAEPAHRVRLTLDIAVADDAQDFVADEQRVRQVLYNLLSNAVGFSKPGGTVYLAVWREAGRMVFVVQDEGVGIPKEQLERVFERFESRSHGSKHRGTGVGLSIVKSLVELHGGDVAIASEPGIGTRVTVRFPERGIGRGARPAAIASVGQPAANRGTAA
jgi:signal transduction histidine kinase